MTPLNGKRIGILAASGSEQTEMMVIGRVLAEAGVTAVTVSPKKQALRGWLNTEWGESFPVDVAVVDATAEEFDGLIIPGGLIAADTLRSDRQAVELVRGVLGRGKPVAAVGHAPWVLIEAGVVRDRRVTSIEAIRSDLQHAGGLWLDDAAVADGPVVTGRNQHDLPDFMALFAETVMMGSGDDAPPPPGGGRGGLPS